MDSALIFDGKNYISAKRAATTYGYNSDYIGQLCRGGLLPARMVGRTWFVLESAIDAHKNGAPAGITEVVKKEITTLPALPDPREVISTHVVSREIVPSSVPFAAKIVMAVFVASIAVGSLFIIPYFSQTQNPRVATNTTENGNSNTAAVATSYSIQNSFSDEVRVAPGSDDSYGVVTPVFKTHDGQPYRYVVFPLEHDSSAHTF